MSWRVYDNFGKVGYFLDHQPIAHAEKIGIPLDKQGAPFTGIYPSAGDGELVAGQLDSGPAGRSDIMSALVAARS